MGPGAVQMNMDTGIPIIHLLAFSIGNQARSRFVAALGHAILERNNPSGNGPCAPDASEQAGELHNLAVINKKVGVHTPVLDVIYYEEWAGKSDQGEPMSDFGIENKSGRTFRISSFEPNGSRNAPQQERANRR